MRLLEASLLDFRNLAEVQLSFSPGVNVLLGDNGHGKTNVLEALNYPALARSFRGARDEELIRFVLKPVIFALPSPKVRRSSTSRSDSIVAVVVVCASTATRFIAALNS